MPDITQMMAQLPQAARAQMEAALARRKSERPGNGGPPPGPSVPSSSRPGVPVRLDSPLYTSFTLLKAQPAYPMVMTMESTDPKFAQMTAQRGTPGAGGAADHVAGGVGGRPASHAVGDVGSGSCHVHRPRRRRWSHGRNWRRDRSSPTGRGACGSSPVDEKGKRHVLVAVPGRAQVIGGEFVPTQDSAY
jgi:hypothetical protein